jgi:hypothetical protein
MEGVRIYDDDDALKLSITRIIMLKKKKSTRKLARMREREN